VGCRYGIGSDDPVVLQETNNTVVWLRPHDVIAKVGTRADSRESLVREFRVARALATIGAQVGEPLGSTTPRRHRATGYVVTLWIRLVHDPSVPPSSSTIGDSLQRLHEDLTRCDLRLPDFRVGIRRARLALIDESHALALAPDDRMFLREVTDARLPRLETRPFQSRPLHGEPHNGNCLLTESPAFGGSTSRAHAQDQSSGISPSCPKPLERAFRASIATSWRPCRR
jgi:Phosphotransferase enzyme family